MIFSFVCKEGNVVAERPLISIIVPVYNVESYLSRCLDSILVQTLTNFEIIAVDDGSPDNCGKILDEYSHKDKRIKVIHKENGGVSSARNVGLDAATGEYIGFVDPDDYIEYDMYEFLYNEAKSGDFDIVQCNYAQVDRDENVTYRLDHIESREYTDANALVCAFFNNDIRSCAWNKLFRHEVVEGVRFLPELRIAEDKLFVHDCLKNAKRLKITDKYCYYYVVSNSSVIHSKISEKLFDNLKVLDILYEIYKNNEYVLKGFQEHSAELILDVTFKVLASHSFKEKLPELIKRVLDLKEIILKGNFSKKKKMFTLILGITPQIACAITSVYLKRG